MITAAQILEINELVCRLHVERDAALERERVLVAAVTNLGHVITYGLGTLGSSREPNSESLTPLACKVRDDIDNLDRVLAAYKEATHDN